MATLQLSLSSGCFLRRTESSIRQGGSWRIASCCLNAVQSKPPSRSALSIRSAGRSSFSSSPLLLSRTALLAAPVDQASQTRQRVVAVRAGKGDEDLAPATDRIIASVGYFLPFVDGVKYGRFLYLQYPLFRAVLDPVVPAVQLYNSIPFAGFAAFFLLYLGVIQNQNMSRYVRYNCMQAVVLDILMILPSLFERLFNFRDGVGFQITVICYNTVFMYLFACFVFGVGSCLLGRSPRLPLVADAAEAQVPF